MANPSLRVQLPVLLVVFIAGYVLFGVLNPVSPVEAAVLVSVVFVPIHYLRLVYAPGFDSDRFVAENGRLAVLSVFALTAVLVFVPALALAFAGDAIVSTKTPLRLVVVVGLPALVVGLLGSRVVERIYPEYRTD